mmetsp:Transcript_185/g.319  ORF Transcript_185/g.319 Transcript_185/m.319 type:complete len:475 (-) Transcript_185:3123-4547(-)
MTEERVRRVRRSRRYGYLYAAVLALWKSERVEIGPGGTTLTVARRSRRRKVLILMSDTGGGHRASAQALRSALEDLHGDDILVEIADFWVDIAGFPFTTLPQSYKFAASHPPLWLICYLFASFPPARWLIETSFDLIAAEKVRAAFESFDPDIVVSVHPMVQEITVRVLRRIEKASGVPKTPFVTVITDLGAAHPMWFNRSVDVCFLPGDHLRAQAIQRGVEPSKLRSHGLPVRPSFWSDIAELDVLKVDLEMKAGIPAVLLVGGGDGIGRLEEIAVQVAQGIYRERGALGGQLVVVCGKNRSLRNALQSRQWPIPVLIHGFVSRMSDFMAVSDILISKAGPGTIAEALIRGLPIIVSGYLPGQEKGNVDFVVENGVGTFAPKPQDISETVSKWLSDPDKLWTMRNACINLGRPQASMEIARDVIGICDQREPERTLSKKRRALRKIQQRDVSPILLIARLSALFDSVANVLLP